VRDIDSYLSCLDEALKATLQLPGGARRSALPAQRLLEVLQRLGLARETHARTDSSHVRERDPVCAHALRGLLDEQVDLSRGVGADLGERMAGSDQEVDRFGEGVFGVCGVCG
jgi:hypothetical protein